MTDTLLFVLRVYPALLAGFALLFILFTIEFDEVGDTDHYKATINLGFLMADIPMRGMSSRRWLVRIAVGVLGILLILYSVSVDASRYFPQNLSMNVYFDVEGIERQLQRFDDDDIAGLNISDQWKEKIAVYDTSTVESLNALVEQVDSSNSAFFESDVRDSIYAVGTTTFKVRKVSMLRYRITESNGLLVHTIDPKHGVSRQFESEFTLRETSHNFIQPSLGQLFSSYLIRPEFKQIFSLGPLFGVSKSTDHVVIGATNIRVLPFPSIGDTIYLLSLQNGQTVPMAYSVYY